MLDQQRLREQSLAATRADKLGHVDEKMHEKEEGDPHRATSLVCFLLFLTLQNAQRFRYSLEFATHRALQCVALNIRFISTWPAQLARDLEDALKQRALSHSPGSVARVGVGGRFLLGAARLPAIRWILGR